MLRGFKESKLSSLLNAAGQWTRWVRKIPTSSVDSLTVEYLKAHTNFKRTEISNISFNSSKIVIKCL